MNVPVWLVVLLLLLAVCFGAKLLGAGWVTIGLIGLITLLVSAVIGLLCILPKYGR